GAQPVGARGAPAHTTAAPPPAGAPGGTHPPPRPAPGAAGAGAGGGGAGGVGEGVGGGAGGGCARGGGAQRRCAGLRGGAEGGARAGLSVEVGRGEKLAPFYEIFAERMRDLGSPVHAPRFFRAVLDAFGARARIALVRKGGTPVGGLVALAFKDRLAVPWASCLKEYLSLCPNMLLYWEVLRTACVEGFRTFDFGRSSRHSGTYRCDCQWA